VSTPPYMPADDPIGELRRQQARIGAIRKKLGTSTTKVTSNDRGITVTISQNGTLESIEFNSQKFRKMAPAELGAILTETIKKAQVESRERIMRAYKPVLPDIMGIGNPMAGAASIDEIFDNAAREIQEMMRGIPPRGAASGNGASGRSFNGSTVNDRTVKDSTVKDSTANGKEGTRE
jgi:hypothetical protein